MKIKSERDFVSGLMFIIVGVAFAWGATNYTVGQAARMGPGYFPLMLGIVLAILGSITLFDSLVVETEDGEKIGKIAWRPLVFIVGSNVIFGILLGGLPSLGIPAMGLIVATYGVVLVAAQAGDQFRIKEVLILATILAVLSYVAFIKLLKLQFPVWPSFIVG
ncbi:MAG: tripartite tricarboxylate transporter TctB family protein [Ramlibacter sp.]